MTKTNLVDLAERVIRADLVPEVQAVIAILQAAEHTPNPAQVLPRNQSAPVSAERILPADARLELEQLRGEDDITRWRIGDIAREQAETLAGTQRAEVNPDTGELTGRKLRNTKKDIRAAIADSVGLTPSTVRQYESAATAYQGHIREKYAETLTFTHYREALRGHDPEAWLAWCVTSADDKGGKIAPPRVLAAAIAEAEHPGKPPVDPDKNATKARALLDEALDALPELAAYAGKRAKWQTALSCLLEA